MSQKENSNFTGFKATYQDGSTIVEKENFFSKKLGKKCMTNWAEIDKENLKRIELYWKGIPTAAIDKADYPNLLASDWYFFHTGFMDISDRKIKTQSRCIGYKEDGIVTIFSIDEGSGVLKVTTRAA